MISHCIRYPSAFRQHRIKRAYIVASTIIDRQLLRLFAELTRPSADSFHVKRTGEQRQAAASLEVVSDARSDGECVKVAMSLSASPSLVLDQDQSVKD